MSSLHSKRMGNKHPNGNIIVTATGSYNRFDGGAHFHKWQRIARHYAVGRPGESMMLTATQLQRKAPEFLSTLSGILGKSGSRPIDIISRKGARLSPMQVRRLLRWLHFA